MMPSKGKFHPLFGIAVPELGWVPAPSYLLRRDRILRKLRAMAPGAALEIGCGSGALIEDVRRLGYACQGLESSPSAHQLAMSIHEHSPDVRIHSNPSDAWREAFDYIFAFEVLEHIEHDAAALKEWARWLKRDGTLLISVPAHRRRWSASDVWAGHFRRYERADLTKLLNAAGFSILSLECYGFPLANIIEPVRAWIHGRSLRQERSKGQPDSARAANTSRSGTERRVESRLYPLQSSIVGTAVLRFSFMLQNLFARTEVGTGYLVVAQKC
jgi:SAM-dependent methyltransferase